MESEIELAGRPMLDVYAWLEDAASIARAKRLGIHKLIDMVDLSPVLRKLSENGVVSHSDCRELLRGLVEDGLIDKKHCIYFLI